MSADFKNSLYAFGPIRKELESSMHNNNLIIMLLYIFVLWGET